MAKSNYKQHLLDKLRDELISGQSKYTIFRKLRNGEYEWWPESPSKNDTILHEYLAEAADTCKFETMAARDEAKALHLERYLDQYRKADKANDLDILVTEIMKLPPGQLKKVLTDEVLAVLKKYGYTE